MNVPLNIKDKYIIAEDTQFREKANSKIFAIYEENSRGRGIVHLRRVT